MAKRLKKYFNRELIEAGCDEAGRGCLAGPVFAAAVILPESFKLPFLNDSKQLTLVQRETLRPLIEKQAIAWAVARVDNEKIDEINILNASFLAMHLSVDQLNITPQQLLIDGNRFNKYKDIPHQCIIDGDCKYYSIAAASILAKTYRDDFMRKLHLQFEHYDWVNNKGYGTPKHRAALDLHGISIYHRQSFRLDYSEPEFELENEE